MDRISSLLLPVKVESQPIPTPTAPSLESNLIKQEQPDMTNTNTVNIPPPPFIDSISELRSLSTALSTFLRRYDELHDHINLIKSSIDSKLPNHLPDTANPNESTLISVAGTSCTHSITAVPEATVSEQSPNVTASNCERRRKRVRNRVKSKPLKNPEGTDTSKNPVEIDTSMKPEEIDTLKKPEEIDTSKEPEGIITSKKPEGIITSKKPKFSELSELERFCRASHVRGMKDYVSTHISDMNKIREELPKALNINKNPQNFVLDSILQKSKAFLNQSNVGRLARVLILECFLIISSDGIEITEKNKEKAAEAASNWKKRMISEGGLDTADEIDARGLLLLISGFGIPETGFENKDITDLIKASNVSGISTALRCSIILIRKAPELIDWMVKTNMEIEAADLAYTLGLEDKCEPETILKTFFLNKIKGRQQTNLSQINHQLSDLRSLSKCLESHNIDQSKLFPDFKIKEKVQELEKESQRLVLEATTQKWKIEIKPQEETKPKPSRLNMPHQQTGHYGGPPVVDTKEATTQKRKVETKPQEETKPKRSRLNMPHQQTGQYGVVDHMDNGQPYFSQPSLGQPCSSHQQTGHYGGPMVDLMDNGQPYFSQPSLGQPCSSLQQTGHYGGPMVDLMDNGQPYFSQTSLGQPCSSHQQTVVYGGPPVVDHMDNGGPHGREDDQALIDKYLGPPYFSQPSLGQPCFSPPSSSGLIGLYSRPSGREFVESFPMLPRRGPPSDLYSFADKL